ncbi:hypothetical protein BDV3_000605 [Batrachochytrium dendrobatidis]|nr:hypothetical protein O5D80_000664 [Batrachochytrium dendrobatidis]KAK5672222.1 hypothetical protein QVD99_002022 [Batrachochytrium dendrobatidis]
MDSIIQPSLKIFGLGWALSTSLILLLILLVTSFAIIHTPYATTVLFSGLIVWVIYVLALTTSSKIAVGSPRPTQDYVDWTIIPRSVFVIVMVITALAGCGMASAMYVATPIYAKPPLE